MNVDYLNDPTKFLDIYIHERTHTILGKSDLYPNNSGIVEGIANVIPSEILGKLGIKEL